MRFLLLIPLLVMFPLAYGDTVPFCQGNNSNSIFWQKSICNESVTCEIFDPQVSTFEFTEIEYFLAISQTSGYCMANETFLLNPVSYHVKVTDSEFDYGVYDETVLSLELLPNILLYKDIPYNVSISTNWKTYDDDSKYVQYIEDDYGNLIDGVTFDYTLHHEVKVKVKDMGW